jgi:hypothetical protein
MICIREIKLVVESITHLVDDRVCSSSWNERLNLWRLAFTLKELNPDRTLIV